MPGSETKKARDRERMQRKRAEQAQSMSELVNALEFAQTTLAVSRHLISHDHKWYAEHTARIDRIKDLVAYYKTR